VAWLSGQIVVQVESEIGMTEEKAPYGASAPIALGLEEWQIDALATLLATETKEVEEGSRVYVSSKTYGDSRFHLLSKKYDGIQVEQTNIEDKWGSRVNLQTDEVPAVLKTLLSWYLEEVKKEQDRKPSDDEDPLGDLDDNPF
jgi:hypothetical protein